MGGGRGEEKERMAEKCGRQAEESGGREAEGEKIGKRSGGRGKTCCEQAREGCLASPPDTAPCWVSARHHTARAKKERGADPIMERLAAGPVRLSRLAHASVQEGRGGGGGRGGETAGEGGTEGGSLATQAEETLACCS
eukprot:3373128-Rhodomonas_salina.1